MRFYRVSADGIERIWDQVRREWRGDPHRKRQPSQLLELRHALTLGLCDLWVAWEDDPPIEHYNFPGPHYCLGMILTDVKGGSLHCQFLTGVKVRQWLPVACEALSQHAESRYCTQLDLHCRTGWNQELRPLKWTLPFRLHPERGIIRVYSAVA